VIAPVLERLRRFAARLGWFYGLALAIAMAALAAFGHLANEVKEGEFSAFNRAAVLDLHTLAAPWLDQLALTLAALCSPLGIAVMGGFIGAGLLRRQRVLDAFSLGVTLVGAGVLTSTLKHAFNMPRPALYHQLVRETSPSFPSGHALLSFALFGFIGVWLVLENPRESWRWLVAAGFISLAALVAVSRVYLGVHWPTDVLAGAIVATFWLAVCFGGREWLARRERLRRGNTKAL
jgi:undecaprenyl-diphosphatase